MAQRPILMHLCWPLSIMAGTPPTGRCRALQCCIADPDATVLLNSSHRTQLPVAGALLSAIPHTGHQLLAMKNRHVVPLLSGSPALLSSIDSSSLVNSKRQKNTHMS
ncbi:hypothetical protein U9M48_011831 [Paspalum notatum var. saurae]|uniref:Secreted protein n=1 Tax=Paspalum notatum var. saurae TaxID=547442 RepID=A0AAQ3SXV5_PASNO